MRKNHKTLFNGILILLSVLLVFALVTKSFETSAFAKPLDEIENYEVTAVVNEDATVNLTYHIDWKVLDSNAEGPLSWVKVGIPNSHYSDPKALTDNISSIEYDSSGGSYMKIRFDREYFADEVVSFEFSVVQDYLYQVDKLEEGYTVYSFTPGWFEDIAIDKMTIRWTADKASSWDPDCYVLVGNLVWMNKNLAPGEKVTVKITYPNDAYHFDLSKKIEEGNDSSSDVSDAILGLLCLAFPAGMIYGVIRLVNGLAYKIGAGFGNRTQNKIKRTKIVYYDSCPSCGSVRKEGEQKCEYCGHSFIKSEEVIEEKALKNTEKEAAKFTKEGEYQYSDSPNTFVRVNVIPIPRPRRSYSSSGSHRSSCVHSSCACACACACAGGGRAGCSTKDFYKTNLRLSSLRKFGK
ncbi:MAG: zinc ribbon domain-containing protein [Lachnospiraceae bacterium]|nr:zinc ribbon domain-containing protein [Lachnospiraceae bacterium]